MAFSRLCYDWLKLLLSANRVAADGCGKLLLLSKMKTPDKNITGMDDEMNLLLQITCSFRQQSQKSRQRR